MPHDLTLPTLTGQIPYDVEQAIDRIRGYCLELDAAQEMLQGQLATLARETTGVSDRASLLVATLETLQTTTTVTVTDLTPGSVVFIGAANQLAEDNASFFWDAGNARLGLGTASPDFLLDIEGATNPTLTVTDTTSSIATKLQSTNTEGIVGTTSAHDFSLYSNNTRRMTLDGTTGNVGIGTASPGAALEVNGEIRLGSGTASAPSVNFTSATNTGMYLSATVGDDQIGFTFAGVQRFVIGRTGDQFLMGLNSGAFGTGNITGAIISLGRNTSGNGAAGVLRLIDLNGGGRSIWTDATGDLRSSGASPEEDGSPADTSGIVVGDQTSWHALKTVIQERTDIDAVLRSVVDTKVYDFQYVSKGYLTPDGQLGMFTGLVGRSRDDWFLKNVGLQQVPCLNEVNVTGYLVMSIKALEVRLARVERVLAARPQ